MINNLSDNLSKFFTIKLANDSGLNIEIYKGELKDSKPVESNSLRNTRATNIPKPVSMEQEAKKQLWLKGINKLRQKTDPNTEAKQKLTPSYIMNNKTAAYKARF